MVDPALRITCPVARGSGAFVVHSLLAQRIPGYALRPYSPWRSLFPPLIRGCRDLRADLVHAPLDYAAFCAIPGKPLVSTLHGFVFDSTARRYASPLRAVHYATDLRWFALAALRRSTVVTVVSRFLEARLREELRFGGDIRVIYNGVDVDRFTPRPAPDDRSSPVRVLYTGGPSRHKGADLIPAILDRLAPGIEFVHSAANLAATAGIAHPRAAAPVRVGHADMPEVYRSVDLLLAPTRREGFGLSIAEAMACGLPVVATDCAAVPELIRHGSGGMLCPMDDVARFADAVNELAAAPGLRRDMGEFNRARAVAEFAVVRMVREYRELFALTREGFRPA
jgi:glycosyltransferase involved in cell wall biosynthesis